MSNYGTFLLGFGSAIAALGVAVLWLRQKAKHQKVAIPNYLKPIGPADKHKVTIPAKSMDALLNSFHEAQQAGTIEGFFATHRFPIDDSGAMTVTATAAYFAGATLFIDIAIKWADEVPAIQDSISYWVDESPAKLCAASLNETPRRVCVLDGGSIASYIDIGIAHNVLKPFVNENFSVEVASAVKKLLQSPAADRSPDWFTHPLIAKVVSKFNVP